MLHSTDGVVINMEDTETVKMTFKELIDYIIKNNLKVEYDKRVERLK